MSFIRQKEMAILKKIIFRFDKKFIKKLTKLIHLIFRLIKFKID